MKKKVVAVLPSRMGSTRFPGKPLTRILGLSMIEHCRRRAEEFEFLDDVYVATCDQEIKDEVERFGGKVIMTADTHERCTDRIEEAAHKIDADIIINVQGDEPMVSRRSIEAVVKPFLDNDEVKTTCIVYPIKDMHELNSPNIVKTVLSRSNRMLYLSRSPIPGKEVSNKTTYYKQSGIMAFTKEFLHTFAKLESTPLEQKESVDMNRVIEHDYWIQGVICDDETKGIDIPEQVGMIEEMILNNSQEKEIFERIIKIGK